MNRIIPANDVASAPPWWANHNEIARLLHWLQADPERELEMRDVLYLVEKPWKWTGEYQAMLVAQGEQAAEERAERGRPGLSRADGEHLDARLDRGDLDALLEASLAVVRGAKGGR